MIANDLIRAVMHAKITEGEFFWIEADLQDPQLSRVA